MECRWDEALLRRADVLPPELIQSIRHVSNEQYLAALTRAVQDARFTYLIFAYCSDIFAHLCADIARTTSRASAVIILSRVIHLAPHLGDFALDLLSDSEVDFIEDEQTQYLLGLLRLLQHKPRTFSSVIESNRISTLLDSKVKSHRYLAIRILQIHYDAADHWFEQMVHKYIGENSPENAITGVWDDREIDYRFLTLWEEQRSARLQQLVATAQEEMQLTTTPVRIIPKTHFSPQTSMIGQSLFLSQVQQSSSSNTDMIMTKTALLNATRFARRLQQSGPILVHGVEGSGKTSLIRYAANQLGKLDTLVTLHLNEQSDAKLLVGIYTTGDTPGSIVWKPGVLTTAMREGRWVVIEDIDRAPDNVIGSLLPLIEHSQLSIPSRKQTIFSHQGFRLFATTKASKDRDAKVLPHMLARRVWKDVLVEDQSLQELESIVKQRYPSLTPLLTQIMTMYQRLRSLYASQTFASKSRTGLPRAVSSRDLFTWCSRQSHLLKNSSTLTTSDIDTMFLEAADCFAGSMLPGTAHDQITSIIAEDFHIDPQRRDHLLRERIPAYQVENRRVQIGRFAFSRAAGLKKKDSSFSTNQYTVRMMERIAASVSNREPLLLVGETGVGKTTAIQHLAGSLGKKLVPFNLSQQSESGDLLGGFKPVNTRSIVIALKDDFDTLFQTTFSHSKNQQFLDHLNKYLARGKWKAVCKLWREALKMVADQQNASRQAENPSKKRKTEPIAPALVHQWDEFASRLTDLERQITSGAASFTFKFVEGNIVKAMREGDWILLDEINLAASDTLEALIDILDPKEPSILLTEAGDIRRVIANPEFRVFAAMNPATDVGKKDLPPGIRSRFTELYVESPDSDLKSLQSIVQAYLGQVAADDVSVAADVSILYRQIQDLASQNKLVDGAGQKPHFSLRTLTRTLSYARQIASLCNLRRALYEGFQMSFMTFLDIESSKLVMPLLHKQLFRKKTNVPGELQKPLRKPSDGSNYILAHPQSKHYIRRGPLEAKEESHYIITPFIRDNLENLVRASSTRQFPVLIQGPTSSGKTSMIEYLANRSGHKFVRINNHEHTDLQEYLGTYVSASDGKLQFQDGLLVKALREGHWIVLDELNLAPTDVLEALNRLLDDNRELLIPETQEVIRPHPEFMLFATQNPAGLYGGRKTLSRAFRNRFLELHFDDIPIDELQEILEKRTQLPESRCKRIVMVYRELSVLRQQNRIFEQKSFATLRDLFRWAMRMNDTIEQLANNGFMLLAERVRKGEERDLIKSVIERVMSKSGPKVTIDESILYGAQVPEFTQRRHPRRNVVWTKAMRRLFLLVVRALQNNEPVLLVGETGCGKTLVCQIIAEWMSRELHIVNAHQNTETGDLIGSQRPVRNRANIESQLRELLLSHSSLAADSAGYSTDELIEQYQQILSEYTVDAKQAYMKSDQHQQILQQLTRYKALFEWADGSLIQAMKSGSMFLLDEISLADDSVLERLNSVLEPSRSILLAEKGSVDSFVTASSGFQFLATMNPGGDYGKKELSPALRNRFTEIWVPSLDDADDAIEIIQNELITPAKSAAHGILDFAKWFKSRHDASSTSGLSIREILSWVSFINRLAEQDVHLAVIQGAALVYIDTLGANPAGLMSAIGESVEQSRQSCLVKLSSVFEIDAHAIYNISPHLTSTSQALTIGPFSITTHNSVDLQSRFSFAAHTTKINTMRVLRAMQLPKPVMLEGSPGVGKTALITALAAKAGVALTRINLSEQTDLIDLFGSDAPIEGSEAGSFAWRDAPFLRAMKSGEWVLLDEMNLASQAVLEGLNAVLDHRGEAFIPELGVSFAKHPDFRLFAAQNPHHQGGGRKGLPASFVNRFTVVFADGFDSTDLLTLAQEAAPEVDPDVLKRVIDLTSKLNDDASHQHFASLGAPWEFNFRDIIKWIELSSSKLPAICAGNAADFMELLFTSRFRRQVDRHHAQDIFRATFDDQLHISDRFTNLSPQMLQIGISLLSRDPLRRNSLQQSSTLHHSPSTLSILQSVMICVQHRWPVLLNGPSGCGKTALLTMLAATVGAEVETVAMHSETDAMDFVGGYEQVDAHRELSQLFDDYTKKLLTLLKSSLVSSSNDDAVQRVSSWQTTLTAFHNNKVSSSDLKTTLQGLSLPGYTEVITAVAQIEHNSSGNRFKWIDGVLIDALVKGKWLILDNANLCSSSVLDRLNSLLEPGGTLALNEHVEDDGSPRIIRPHSDFRIFLTADPKYGELSRAMRNRTVELYMPLETKDCEAITPSFEESAMHRLRQTSALQQHNEVDPVRLSTILVDQLGLNDTALLSRLNREIADGLYEPSLDFSITTINMAAYTNCVATQAANAVAYWQLPADFARAQTIHPLSNPSIFQQDGIVDNAVLRTGVTLDLLQLISASLATASSLQSRKDITQRLIQTEKQMSLGVTRSSKTSSFTLHLISTALSTFQDMLQYTLTNNVQIAQVLDSNGSRAFLAILQQMLEQIQSPRFDVCSLKAGLLLAREQRTLDTTNLGQALQSITSNITQNFSLVPILDATKWGYYCMSMWQSLKPSTATTISQLDNLLLMKAYVDKTDEAIFRFQLPLDDLVALRMSLQRAWQTALANPLADVQSLLDDQSMTFADDDESRGPLFANTFASLYNHHILMAESGMHDMTTEFQEELGVLIQLPALESQQIYLQHDNHHFRIPSPMIAKTRPENQDLFSTLVKEMKTSKSAELQQVPLLRSELSVLAHGLFHSSNIMAINIVKPLDRLLEQSLCAVLGSLHDHAAAREQVQVMLSALGQGAGTSLQQSNAHVPLDRVSIQTFSDVVIYLRSHADTEFAGVRSAARAWIMFSTTALVAYVPDTIYDPGVQASVERAAFDLCQKEIQQSIDVLRCLHASSLGEKSSLRQRLLEEDLRNLGTRPMQHNIIRPIQSQSVQLQTDLDILKRLIENIRQSFSRNDAVHILNESVTTNLRQIRTRLATGYPCYADFTGPVIYFIDSLLLGVSLLVQAEHVEVVHSKKSGLNSVVPLSGGSSSVWQSEDKFISLLQDNAGVKDRTTLLSIIASRNALNPLALISEDLRRQLASQFRNFYEQWSQQLSHDQKEEAAKSNLYKYSGDDAEEMLDVSELSQLFPDHDEETIDGPSGRSPRIHDSASTIFEVHKSLLLTRSSTKDDLLAILNESANTDSSDQSEDGSIDVNLPSALNDIHLLQTSLSVSHTKTTEQNFYHDANMLELNRLSDLILNIRLRFQATHNQWPEHAIPTLIEAQCVKIITIAHSEPLSRFLQSVEQLHATINEWQKIASSEYSAATLFHSLTDMIVDWRRLELSSWSRLFNEEDKVCEKNAASWWFTAYESIVAATQDARHDASDNQFHVVALLTTLEQFLLSSGLGEFETRLNIIRLFSTHMVMLTEENVLSQQVASALNNFVVYFSRFQPAVTKELHDKRQKLEAEIKDVIRLASWRDRNIESLRQSAKASHRKLLRTVRKYRNVLALPVASIIATEPAPITFDHAVDGPMLPMVEAFDGSDTEQLMPQAWTQRPKRYQNMQTTISLMQRHLQPLAELATPVDNLQTMIADLDTAIKELRRATPATKTEKNEHLIGHLKNRKRRLLADVLRALRKMGLQHNIPDDMINKQKSLAHVLTLTKDISESDKQPQASQDCLYRLLGLMPAMRDGARKHSEDLTSAEVARCTSLMESLLDLIIQQRNQMADMRMHSLQLASTMRLLAAVSKAQEIKVIHGWSRDDFTRKLQFFIAVAETVTDLIEKHDALTKDNNPQVREELSVIVAKLRVNVTSLTAHETQPKDLQDAIEEEIISNTNQQYESVKSLFALTIKEHPNLSYLVSHLLRWLPDDEHSDTTTNSQHALSADEWSKLLTSCLDRILAVVEHCQPAISTQDESPAWLRQQQQVIESTWLRLDVIELNNMLDNVLQQISTISDPEVAIAAISTICKDALPLIRTYHAAVEAVEKTTCDLHYETCRLGHFLGSSFIKLVQDGFCAPSEKAENQKTETGDAEAGTGLADGEGAEDISKDVKDDEDLSELAQEGQKEDRENEMEDEKDAVDMADQELEGDLGDAETKSEGDDQSHDGAEAEDMEDEVASVDENDANQLDEKMWDDGKVEDKQDKSSSKGAGTKDDEIAAAESPSQDQQNDAADDDDLGGDEDGTQSDADAEVQQSNVETADEHLQEESNLDLPDDIDLEGREEDDKIDSDVDMSDADMHDDDTLPDTHDETALEDDSRMSDIASDEGSATNEAGEDMPEEDEAMTADEQLQNEMLQKEEEGVHVANDGLVADEQGAGQETDNHDQVQTSGEADAKQETYTEDTAETSNDNTEGTSAAKSGKQGDMDSEDVQPAPDQAKSSFQKLGDALEKWYKQNRPIEASKTSEVDDKKTEKQDVNLAMPSFEHLEDENDVSDAQALGTGSMDQSKALPEDSSIPLNDENGSKTPPMVEEVFDEDMEEQNDESATNPKTDQLPDLTAESKAFIGAQQPASRDDHMEESSNRVNQEEETEDIEVIDDKLTRTHLPERDQPALMSITEATQLWTVHENNTRNLSLMLTEHLRLILQPTQATKMRGDFRTGKRLNIKKIIPYIASSYKRDKIWMRRTIPSKRAYQVMLAIDDSKSMAESDSKHLAFETLAMVAKSLSMLEVGELSVLGFGEHVKVAHDFDTPFTSDAGAKVFQSFTFDQAKTNVRKLLAESLDLFRNARIRATGSSNELWQLQLIISDGVCEDHPSIRQLVREAHEERIMIVFVIVDSMASQTRASQSGDSQQVKQSILDLQTAEFEKDAHGDMQLKMVKYLDTFPFKYYLIVRDTEELPGVLAGALRQWFAEVVDTGSST